ncbi:MAG TPA: PAS domain S-box protein [Gemmatimonadaceae bacterium]|nr:PAS domain S-box protein [Gemmatimonadaceae bacterium]
MPTTSPAFDNRLSEALEHIDGAFVILDRKWNFTFVNSNAVRPIDLVPADVIGRNIWEMFPEFRDTTTAAQYQEAMDQRRSSRFEDRSPVNGRWYEISVYPVPEGVAAHWHDVTDRKLAELALAESEERARMTAEAALTGLFDWEPHNGRMYWSDQNFRTLGLEPGDVEPSYAAWAARVHPDDLPLVEALLRAAQAEHRPYYGVHRVVWPDGSIHVMEARAQFSYDAAGTCTRMRGTYVDITDRALAEQALRESEARFRAMADDAPLPIWVTDADGAVQFINRAYREFFGVGDGDAGLVDWPSLIHPDHRAYVASFAECVRDRRPFRAEARARRWDGAWRWIASHGVPRSTNDGTFLGFVGTSPDVTERRLLEEHARSVAIHAHFRSLFESLPGPYVVLTPDDFRIVAVSDAYLAATGTTREGLIDKTLFDVFADDASSGDALISLRASLARVVTHRCVDVIAVHRLPVRRPEALGGGIEERWWSPVSAPVFDAEGRVAFIIHRAEDVTCCMTALDGRAAAPDVRHWAAEIVLRAEELQRSNERLREEMDDRRRLEEQRAELMRQLVLAQEAERRRVARELHDGLGQHLTALQLGLEAMTGSIPCASEMHGRLSRLQALAHTLDHEVDRIAADLRPAVLDDLGLDDALRRHVREWEQQTGVTTDIHTRGLEERVAPVLETTVYRIVQEALTNVRKHARATRAGVVVERRDGRLVAIVEDNGVGLAAATGTGPRAGLGLSTMRERAVIVGGDFQVESVPGVGTTVYFQMAVDG